MVERADERARVAMWAAGLEEAHRRIAPRFARAEPRRRALAYLRGLLHPVERKNGWQLAEQAGERTPDGMQRLLDAAAWDADAVRDDRRAVLVVDETGFLKQGAKSAGVQRQYSGTAGRIENGQVGVFRGYASTTGRALLDRELYLPEEWLADRPRCAEAGIPEGAPFRTRPQLARALLERALAAGGPFRWVTGDEVYGGDVRLRVGLEEHGGPHVLALKRSELLGGQTDRGPHQVAAEAIAAQVPTGAWRRLSAGAGSTGPRLDAWARFPVRPWSDPERGYWLLVRRSRAAPADRAYYVC